MVGMGAARKAWGDFSGMHQELEEMSRQNEEMLGLQVLQAKSISRDGAVEVQNIQGEIFRGREISLGYLTLAAAILYVPKALHQT